MLDTRELVHLALHASRKGDTHAAMSYLKEALQQEPDHAVARYLLAAEHAEIGLYDRAIEGMAAALRLAPELDIAAFQLGLLQLQTRQVEAALPTFQALAQRSQDTALRAFALGYQGLIGEDRDAAIRHFREGLATCANPALARDIERVMDDLAAGTETPRQATPATEPAMASALMLGAYRDSLDPG